MSILIKSMEMPKTCYDCYFCRTYDEPNQGYFCIPLFADLHRTDFTKKRIDACPLVEVPTPYGDLIDREALIKALHTWFDDDEVHAFEKDVYWHHGVVMKIINDAPTIIESECE